MQQKKKVLSRQIRRTRVSLVINTAVINTDRLAILGSQLRVVSEIGEQTVDCFAIFGQMRISDRVLPSRRRDVRRAVAHAKRSKCDNVRAILDFVSIALSDLFLFFEA